MFTQQKKSLAEAIRLHNAAIGRKREAHQRFARRRQRFLGEPLNLLYPYLAGILICASQLKNDAEGLKRIPFMNLAKAGVGVWSLVSRVQKIREQRLRRTDQLDDSASNELS